MGSPLLTLSHSNIHKFSPVLDSSDVITIKLRKLFRILQRPYHQENTGKVVPIGIQGTGSLIYFQYRGYCYNLYQGHSYQYC